MNRAANEEEDSQDRCLAWILQNRARQHGIVCLSSKPKVYWGGPEG